MADDQSTPRLLEIPRQTKFLQIPEVELADYFKAVEETFGDSWDANSDVKDRIEQVWLRHDSKATIQLASFGYCLRTVQRSDKQWFKDCVGDIRSGEVNRQTGAIFEMNVMGWLGGGSDVKPAKYGTAGLDATIKYPNNDELLLSIKNHDISYHENTLEQNARKFRERMREVFNGRGVAAINAALTASAYVTESDWAKLISTVDQFPIDASGEFREVLPGIHLRIVRGQPEPGQTFAPGFFSDSLVVLVPYHANEQPNFISKVEDAALQMKNKCKTLSGKKGCVIRVHPTASIPRLTEIANQLINERESPGVDFIALYQPAFTTDLKQNTTTLSHYLGTVASPRWNPADHPIHFGPLIGVHTLKPTLGKIVFPDSTLRDCSDHYLLCRGQHFYRMSPNAAGEFTINISMKPGFIIYPVFNNVVVGNVMAPDDSLLLI